MDHIASTLSQTLRNIEIVGADPVTQHGFTQVPNFLFKNTGLSMGAIVVYSKFLSYAWNNNWVFPGQQTLADELDVSRKSVNTWIAELETAGLIEVKQRGLGKTNLYRLHYQVKPKKKA
jgi:predicted transcriptional regulator